jgi:hypothetical protein
MLDARCAAPNDGRSGPPGLASAGSKAEPSSRQSPLPPRTAAVYGIDEDLLTAEVMRLSCENDSPETRGREERFRPLHKCDHRGERALHVTLTTFQGLQPELEIHELPQEHHVILTHGARGDDLVVFLHEPENLFDVVDSSLLEGA